MATQVRLELNSPGIRALLTDPQMRKAMEEMAEEVARRARGRGIMVDGEPGEVPLPIAVVPAHGRTRARALVVIDHPAGVAVEAKDRVLGGALG
jgi:hypothetical protein